MKRIITFLFAAMLAGQAVADDFFTIDNLKYTIIDEENHYVSVSKGDTEPDGALEIPATVEYNSVTYTVTTIGFGGFRSCEGLTSVVIPVGVTTIEHVAFSDCENLTSISIPNTLTYIGSLAFNQCPKTNFTFENHLKYLGTSDNAYFALVDTEWGYSDMTSCTINSNCKIIAGHSLSYTELTSVTIPGNVTTICEEAFYNCNSLTTVTIPEGVTTIGDLAFGYCESLESVTIPASVTSIGYGAFGGCSGLTSVTIPEGVTTIDEYAFRDCSSLVSVTIPASVTSIGYGAFEGCGGLTSATISEGVTTIDECAFRYCSSLESVTIPASVTSIGEQAFYYCTGLTSVTIPNSVTSIGYGAFKGCSGLASVTIPEGVTTIDESMFEDCISLEAITIPASVTSIGYSAFKGCSGLTSVTISEGVTTIDEYAFRDCSSLVSVSIPASATTISASAFNGCGESIYTIENGGKYLGNSENEYLVLMGAESETTSCTIMDGCKIIADRAFSNSSLTTVTIPASVTTIGGGALSAYPLSTINVENGNSEFSSENGILFNQDKTILIRCPLAKSGEITIPNSVTTIDKFAFYQCRNITSVTIPTSVTTIGHDAFAYCTGLTTFTVPSSIETIEQNMLYGCSNLESVTISEGITSIGSWSFAFCDKLTTVLLPSSVTTISWFAFCSCKGLVSVVIPASVTTFENNVFDRCTNSTTVYLVSAEKPAGWNFGNCKVKTGCKNVIVAANKPKFGKVSASDFIAEAADGSLWYENNAEATIKATPAANYHFTRWSDNINTNPRNIVISSDTTLTAYFAIDTHEITAGKTNGGTITGAGTYNYGEEIKLTAVPNDGYHFEKWSDGNTHNPRTIEVSEDMTLSAVFALTEYTITVNAENGNVTGHEGILLYGTEVTFSAKADDGYVFVRWSDDNTDNPRTITVTDNLTLTAVFEKKEEPTAIVDVANTANIYAYGNTIVVENATDDICVYNAMGILVAKDKASAVYTTTVSEAGVYIVKTGNTVKRLMIN